MTGDDLSQRPASYPPLPPGSERIIVAAALSAATQPAVDADQPAVLRFSGPAGHPGGAGAVGAMFSLSGGVDRGVDEHYHSLSKTGTDKIAIISVEGAILDGEGFIKKQIDHVRDDKNVRAVVLRVNSPGGTVTASDYLYHHLRQMLEGKIPMVVSMGGIAASGGYYIAMAVGDGEKVIYAEPTTWTGSIGVIIPHYNVAGLMKTWEIEEDSIKSGPLKQMGTPTKAMTPEERRFFSTWSTIASIAFKTS